MERSKISSIKIRTANLNDLDAIEALENECFLPSEAASRSNLKKRIASYPQGFLVAIIDQEIVGLLNCGCTHKEDISDEALKSMIGHDPEGAHLVIFGLAVTQSHRGKGIAYSLLDHLKQSFSSKESILLLCKEHLVPYYEKYGFINKGLSESTHGGFSWFQMKFIL